MRYKYFLFDRFVVPIYKPPFQEADRKQKKENNEEFLLLHNLLNITHFYIPKGCSRSKVLPWVTFCLLLFTFESVMN